MKSSIIETRETHREIPVVTADGVLVRRTLEGDSQAFDLLVRRYERQVYSLLYRTLGVREDAEDLTQQAFIRAYHALSAFRQDASFLTWLYKIASNLSIDLMRTRQAKRTSSIDEALDGGYEPITTDRQDDPEAMAVRGSVDEIVHAAVMELPDRYRIAVLLRHNADMSIDEIAEELGLPTGTVKTHLYRARELLRQRLRPLLEIESNGSE
ncbi:MAG: sigma-70 family RNA polymerase sigma factor [Chthonomonadales bacterium]|nr:sigma-70 family RNA polymerase sigma factor [Chthonomonadales bacterium]